MRHSMKVGLSFGCTSGIITTLGLIIGLSASTNSKLAVIGGILTIAIADAFSDALGIHVSEESENRHSQKEIWESTFSTFIAKFLFALSFVAPVIFLELWAAVYASIVWGFVLISILSFWIAGGKKESAWYSVIEHVILMAIVIIIAHFAGLWIASVF